MAQATSPEADASLLQITSLVMKPAGLQYLTRCHDMSSCPRAASCSAAAGLSRSPPLELPQLRFKLWHKLLATEKDQVSNAEKNAVSWVSRGRDNAGAEA